MPYPFNQTFQKWSNKFGQKKASTYLLLFCGFQALFTGVGCTLHSLSRAAREWLAGAVPAYPCSMEWG